MTVVCCWNPNDGKKKETKKEKKMEYIEKSKCTSLESVAAHMYNCRVEMAQGRSVDSRFSMSVCLFLVCRTYIKSKREFPQTVLWAYSRHSYKKDFQIIGWPQKIFLSLLCGSWFAPRGQRIVQGYVWPQHHTWLKWLFNSCHSPFEIPNRVNFLY